MGRRATFYMTNDSRTSVIFVLVIGPELARGAHLHIASNGREIHSIALAIARWLPRDILRKPLFSYALVVPLSAGVWFLLLCTSPGDENGSNGSR